MKPAGKGVVTATTTGASIPSPTQVTGITGYVLVLTVTGDLDVTVVWPGDATVTAGQGQTLSAGQTSQLMPVKFRDLGTGADAFRLVTAESTSTVGYQWLALTDESLT